MTQNNAAKEGWKVTATVSGLIYGSALNIINAVTKI